MRLGTVLTVVAVLAAMLLAGGSCADPMEKMVKAEAEAERTADAGGADVVKGAPAAAAAGTGS
ncbi:hypothetical protein [Streptomyces nigrescens]